MGATLLKALIALAAATIALCFFAVLAMRKRNSGYILLLFGAIALTVTVTTHVFEALSLFRAMHFGFPHTIGRYLDLSSALLGVLLIVLGVIRCG